MKAQIPPTTCQHQAWPRPYVCGGHTLFPLNLSACQIPRMIHTYYVLRSSSVVSRADLVRGGLGELRAEARLFVKGCALAQFR